MWDKIMKSEMHNSKKAFEEEAKKDTGLLRLGPRYRRQNKAVSEDRLLAILPDLEKYYELWLSYPDKLMYQYLPPSTGFKLYPFQTLSLRANFRHKYVFQVATRGYSKSFIAVISKYLNCILLPGHKASMVAEHKNQAAKIGREKLIELWQLMPALKDEINFVKGSQTTLGEDYIRLVFKNTSEFDIVGVGNSTRGGRRHSMLLEEVKDLPATEINEVVLPLLNISRRTKLGELNKNEKHQQQLFVGSAGYKNTFAYEKCIEVTLMSVVSPTKAFSWGGDYRIPMHYGLIDEETIEDIQSSDTYTDSSFSREYMSKWTGTNEDAFFDFDKMTKIRTLKKFETCSNIKAGDDVFYVAAVDVARTSARSIIEIFKVRRGKEHFTMNLVNIIAMEGRNFLQQSIKLKQLDHDFGFEAIVIDANGLGVGLVDFLMVDNVDAVSGAMYKPLNVKNIDDYPDYKIEQKAGALAKIFVVKTNQHNAGAIHSNCYNQVFSGRLKLLVDEREAKDGLMNLQKGQKMSYQERIRYMEPYRLTSLLIAETTNLKINRSNVNLKLEMINTSSEKDTFSAMEYGLWYIKEEEKLYYSKLNKKNRRLSNYLFSGRTW